MKQTPECSPTRVNAHTWEAVVNDCEVIFILLSILPISEVQTLQPTHLQSLIILIVKITINR